MNQEIMLCTWVLAAVGAKLLVKQYLALFYFINLPQIQLC